MQHMDIREPLSTLRTLLEQRLGVELTGYQFWLQDAQVVSCQLSVASCQFTDAITFHEFTFQLCIKFDCVWYSEVCERPICVGHQFSNVIKLPIGSVRRVLPSQTLLRNGKRSSCCCDRSWFGDGCLYCSFTCFSSVSSYGP